MIYWELSKKFELDQTNKWYTNNQGPVLENETHENLWYFVTLMEHLITARRPDLVRVNKKKKEEKKEQKKEKWICQIMNFITLEYKTKENWNFSV